MKLSAWLRQVLNFTLVDPLVWGVVLLEELYREIIEL